MMYRNALKGVIAGVGFLALAAGAGPAEGDEKKPGGGVTLQEKKLAPVVKPDSIRKTPLRPGVLSNCPDPAAHRIDFSIVQRTSQFAGRVKIVGVVKNVGQAAYESGPNQQDMYIYENNRLVARQPFHNLAPGQEVTVQHERAWNSSSPAEGEFPPAYKLAVSYDPDIYIDGNPKNNDCRSANNQKERSGADINALFH